MFAFTCPNCKNELRSKSEPPEGRKVKCKQCEHIFVPKVRALAEQAAPVAAAPAPAPPPKKVDDEDDVNPYGVIKEEETQEQIEAKKKVRFDGVDDKKKRSARGPAMSLLVMPSNLLIMWGGLLCLIGIGIIIYGGWSLVFSEVAPSDDDYADSIPVMLFGVITCVWGAMICLGSSRMQNLESYTWALTGAIMAIPIGVYALVMLRNPKVIAGFQEVDGAVEEEEEEDEDEDEDDEDDDD